MDPHENTCSFSRTCAAGTRRQKSEPHSGPPRAAHSSTSRNVVYKGGGGQGIERIFTARHPPVHLAELVAGGSPGGEHPPTALRGEPSSWGPDSCKEEGPSD